METYTFKKIDNHETKVDAYYIKGEQPRPAVLFIHGGGLIMGSRKAIVPSQIEAFNESGYHFLSIDYRTLFYTCPMMNPLA
jgi:acetyl esterase/lipase